MLLWEISIWLGLFIAYFILDGVYAKNIKAIQGLQPNVAANTSALIYLVGIIGTYLCVKDDNLLYIIPITIGAWLGTNFAVRWEIEKVKEDEQSRTVTKSSRGSVGTIQKEKHRLWGRLCRVWRSWCPCKNGR